MNGSATDLERLVAQAEERLSKRKQGSGDSYTPAFMTVNPDGTIAFNFTGHVFAEGLDMYAATEATPPADKRLRFLREQYGPTPGPAENEAAYIAGTERNDQAGLDLVAQSEFGIGSGRTTYSLRSKDEATDVAPLSQFISMEYSDIVGENFTHRVLRQDRSSDFMLARGCHAFRFGNTVIANTATAAVSIAGNVFDVTDVSDGAAGFLTQGNGATLWTCRRAGLYVPLVYCNVGSGAGFGSTWSIRQNGAAVMGFANKADTNFIMTRYLTMNVGDTIDVTAQNLTGASQTYSVWLMTFRAGAATFLGG